MDVVRHEDKFVELKNPSLPIAEQSVEKESSGPFGAKESSAFPSHRCNEKCALGEVVHSGWKPPPKACYFFRPARSRALPRYCQQSILNCVGLWRCDIGHK